MSHRLRPFVTLPIPRYTESRGGHRGLSAPQHMDESPFGEAPEDTQAVIAALQEERNDNFPRAVRALGNRNFRLFWTGNFLSNIGSWMQNVA